MKAAIITPIEYLDTTRDREFHLLLTHLLDPLIDVGGEYRQFYQDLRRSNLDTFMILDNSAHENTVGESIQKVLALGQSLAVNEIVIPDHLFNSVETLARAKDAFEYLLSKGGSSLYFSFRPRLMVVPQGKSRKDYDRCSFNLSTLIREFRKEFREKYRWSPTITFGVSKDYEIWDGGLYRVLAKTIIPAATSFEADIHILGWGRDLWAHRTIAEDFGDLIRSTDSARPFVYGYNNIYLNSHYIDIPEYPGRSKTYFRDEFSTPQLQASLHNVAVFDATVKGEVVV